VRLSTDPERNKVSGYNKFPPGFTLMVLCDTGFISGQSHDGEANTKDPLCKSEIPGWFECPRVGYNISVPGVICRGKAACRVREPRCSGHWWLKLLAVKILLLLAYWWGVVNFFATNPFVAQFSSYMIPK